MKSSLPGGFMTLSEQGKLTCSMLSRNRLKTYYDICGVVLDQHDRRHSDRLLHVSLNI
jgi:hypothetical protein